MRPQSALKFSFRLEEPRTPATATAKLERPPSTSTLNGRRSISTTRTACSAHRLILLITLEQKPSVPLFMLPLGSLGIGQRGSPRLWFQQEGTSSPHLVRRERFLRIKSIKEDIW